MMTMPTSGTAQVTLPTDTEILITREFAAAPHLVYKAWTTPELIRRWWAGRQGEMTVVDVDLRVGGLWRYVLIAQGGFEVGFHGTYREIVPNERIVTSEIYEGVPGGELRADGSEPDDPTLNVITFVDVDGRTRLELLVRCPNQEVRDLILNSGMEVGMQQQYDLLDALVISLS